MNIVKHGFFVLIPLLLCHCAFAQSGNITITENAAAPAPKTGTSIAQYKDIYGLSPDSVYLEYVTMLLDARQYSDAEKIVAHQIAIHPENPYLHIDLGTVYLRQRKDEKAREQFELILKMINGDDMLTQRIVKSFLDAGNNDYAILAYEKAATLLNYPSYYAAPLAKLYAKCGELGKAIDMLLIPTPGMGLNVENLKAVLLELLGDDAAKLKLAQKALITRINEHPENIFYTELLTWVYTQKNDWDGALMQMEAIDERNNEGGKHLVELARIAANARQYATAIKAYDEVISKGKEAIYYAIARSERLSAGLAQLVANHAYTAADVVALRTLYDSFFVAFPHYYSQQTTADYALLEAQYDNNVAGAIEILQRGLNEAGTRREMAGKFKLQMGDYYVLQGRLWDASLTYSQVDKEFKQDVDGEDARFRNAKLAYYRGDFPWAQRQLTRLKSATSELIANDAISLSVLITENVPDSDVVPLQRFAYAGLLLFQNKDKEVEKLLDSLNAAYPKNPLEDDILMMRAEMQIKHHEYTKALAYLENIYKKYGEDVLGDDAVYKMATIYQDELHQPDQAKHYYEQLIIDYPGSTYVQIARRRLTELNNGSIP